MAARGFLGAGDLYLARYNVDIGSFDPLKGPYEASKFEIKPNVELKEMASRGRSTYGQIIESVPVPQPSEFNISLSEVNRESLTIALLGTAQTLTQGSGTVVDEVIVAKLESWIPLTKKNVTEAGLSVTNSAGSTTYALGTDYEINYRLGWIKAKSGGAITEGQSLKVDYGYSAISGSTIRGSTNSQIRAKFVLDGVNFADSLPVIVTVHEAIITTDSAFDFLSADFANLDLSGRMKTPTGMTEPFTVELRDA